MRVIGNVTAYYTRDDYPSHHFLCDFTIRNVTFSSMEQMMMYSKSKLFGDDECAHDIMNTQNCQQQKLIGRKVQGFNREEWEQKSPGIVFVGNREKYRQNPALLKLLLATYPTILVEATRKDRIWGCGIDEDDDRVADPANWTGENRHGNIQMKVRQYFMDHPDQVKFDAATPFRRDKHHSYL